MRAVQLDAVFPNVLAPSFSPTGASGDVVAAAAVAALEKLVDAQNRTIAMLVEQISCWSSWYAAYVPPCVDEQPSWRKEFAVESKDVVQGSCVPGASELLSVADSGVPAIACEDVAVLKNDVAALKIALDEW